MRRRSTRISCGSGEIFISRLACFAGFFMRCWGFGRVGWVGCCFRLVFFEVEFEVRVFVVMIC